MNLLKEVFGMPRTKKAADATTAEETKTVAKDLTAGLVNEYNVTMWFTQPLLGSAPGDPDIYKKFIASKAPDAPTREEELMTNTVENVAAKGTNVFLRRTVTGNPTLGQHTVKGFYKERITATKRQKGGIEVTNHKTKIVGNITISPVFIDLQFPEELVKETTEDVFRKEGFGHAQVVRFPHEPGSRFRKVMLPTCDRPLQAETAQGKITSIASSEMAPAGTKIEYKLKIDVLKKDPLDEDIMRTILTGIDHGTGQWRGSGEYGAFVAEIKDNNGNMIFENTSKVIGCTSDSDEFMDKLFEYIESTVL